MAKPFYITTPIYYVNDKPHIGHAYTTIAADMTARFHRLAGREVFFVTGTDEHGNKIAEAAEAAGITEIEFCDKTVETFKTAWKNLNIENDYFIRTTSERHKKAVWKILDAMMSAKTPDGQDVVYSDYYEGLYCNGCEKFITEKELVDGLCPDHKKAPEKLKEKNYFIRLSSYLPIIKEMIEKDEIKIIPDERRREVLGLINQEPPDFSLSRERVKWGVPLSFDKSQVAYVWVDALSNYLSAIGYGDDADTFDKWWTNAEVAHLMAKDILKFHCLLWPAMLLAAGEKTPETILLHGFFTVNGEKMSKSLGNMIDPNEVVDEFGADAARYLLLTQFPFGGDGDVKANQFITQYNSDLANDLGNLVSRVVKMVQSNFDSVLPAPMKEVDGLEELLALAEKTPNEAYAAVKHFQLPKAIELAMGLVKAANKFFNDTAPWKLAKAGKVEEMGGILYACCEVIRIVSVLLTPIMPDKMKEIREIFSLTDESLSLENACEFFVLEPGLKLKFNDAVFPRLNPKKKEKKADKDTEPDNLLDISEFAKVELKVAEVLKAEPVEGADRLLKLQIDLGSEKRQIVAGIAEFYTPEKIVGMKVVVVANLKPARIRNVESNGMLLAAKKGKKLAVVTPADDLPAGAKIS